jgi:ubiquitin-small subunit ribosomal protein S27Ae
MAAPAKAAAPAAKKGGKKGRWNLYTKAGDKVERKNKSCPKCGQGTFLANHKSRLYCGQCKYTEFIKQ